ncbi:flagellar hook assembly protein FlgD [Methyloversatilis sp.]|uniref:flagellar hook assembly protein FlgD n=1 Tax=Methyloversatilis sp. TaxID=2569862 RepID=UPI0035B1E10E
MATSSVSGTSPSAIYSSLNTREAESQSEVEEAQNRFLMLLTTQLKMQDPLSPMDNAQVTSQLAQISTVDGIAQLNATLEQLTASTSDTQHLQATSLVDRAVLVPGSSLNLVEGKAMGGIQLESGADEMTITIKAANGTVVHEIKEYDIDAGIFEFVWEGENSAGTTVAKDGAYSYTVKAVQGGKAVVNTALELAVVNSVERVNGVTKLNVGQTDLVTMNDIKQIY